MDLPKKIKFFRALSAQQLTEKKSSFRVKQIKRESAFRIFGRSGSEIPPRKFASNSFLMEVLSFLVLLGNERFRFFTKSAQRDSRV